MLQAPPRRGLRGRAGRALPAPVAAGGAHHDRGARRRRRAARRRGARRVPRARARAPRRLAPTLSRSGTSEETRCCRPACASAPSSRPSTPSTRTRPSRSRATWSSSSCWTELGYDEAWIGEHHSARLRDHRLARALHRRRVAAHASHIRLGTGVSSLPYHHPLMLADRINQLDHMTRGRVMFGVGPGALPSDAFMMGIDVAAASAT